MSFVHLHTHSAYSLLDGLSDIKQLVMRAKALQMPALGLTDHGAMYGVIEFYRACKRANLKAIVGMEGYLATRAMTDRDSAHDSTRYHLLLLAETQTGYQNLLKIATAAQLEGFYYRPRVDHDFLAAHAEGLICTTGCLAAEVPRALATGREAEAHRLLDFYYQVFGPDRFFFELQDHEIPELREVNQALVAIAPRYNARFIATNDVHYVNRADARLHDVLLCIQTSTLLSEKNRMRMSDDSYYLRSPEEMQALFAHIPGALENTLLIAERCSVNLDFDGYRLPHFPVPAGYDAESYLRHLCQEGLRERYQARADLPEVRERLEYELGVIHAMGFDTYFLIVWDLCNFAAERGIWYNARGSAAGSIVAYGLDITLVDPLEHGLIFERFLNPDRVSMPDIDLDFQDDRRHELLEYTAQKYGADKVAQIITFGQLKARAAIRDVGRVMDVPLHEVDRVAKLVPNIPGKPVSIDEALAEVPDFKSVHENEPHLREMIDTATQLEGVFRNAGTHAAGVIVADRPLIEYIPLHRPTGSHADSSVIKATTQFEMEILESLGLLKIDLLGLRTLTVMAHACRLLRARHGVDLDIRTIPTDDPATYALLGRGEVAGVFQVEGAGLRRFLVEMKPQRLDHVIAMVALFRPGPIEFIPSYIRRMHGREVVSYRHPALEPIFKETYGIPVYQEQLMRAAVELAGYTASEADDLRKAVAKKIKKKLMKHREKFIAGAVSRGIPRETANTIFDDWEEFARYGFNKAHATDYGVIAVQTAYLKAHYPVEYMTALLTAEKGDTAKVAFYVADTRRMSIEVLPPDVNFSEFDFSIEALADGRDAIRFGLGAVKNVGEGPVAEILRARAEGDPFADLDDFCSRVDLRQVGKRALESLIKVGALDRCGPRNQMLAALDQLISISASTHKAAEVGQLNMFELLDSTSAATRIQLPAEVSAIRPRQLRTWEKELVGVYVSDHPLLAHMDQIQQVITAYSNDLDESLHGRSVTVAGSIAQIRPHTTAKGQAMAFGTLEDLQGAIDLVIFPRTWASVRDWLKVEQLVMITGKVDAERGDPKLLVNTISREFPVFTPEAGAADQAPAQPTSSPAPASGGLGAQPPEDIWEVLEPADPVELNHVLEADATGTREPPDEPQADDGRPAAALDPADARAGPGEPSVGRSPAAPAAGVADSGQVAQDWHAADGPSVGSAAPAPPGTTGAGNKPAHDGGLAPESDAAAPRTNGPAAGTIGLALGSVRPPLMQATTAEDLNRNGPPKRIIVTLRPTNDLFTYKLRIKWAYNVLTSFPGPDRFVFVVYEDDGRCFELDFVNNSTCYCDELVQQLASIVGTPDDIEIQPLLL